MALINLRNALMTGKRLPYDAEVEYLESTGTQWIDTGYSFNSATDKVELVFELLTTTPIYKWIFGAYDSQKRLAIGSGSAQARRTLGYNASTSYNSSTYYTDGAHIFLADSTGASIDGHNFSGFADFSTTSHILLYTIPLNPSTYCSNSRIWSYKHYRNNVLVRDYIPVRVGSGASAVGYMYDRVSKRLFGNAGTGDFVLGPDVVPVEYIESHGTEYIDTGYSSTGVGIGAKVSCEKTTSATSEMSIVGRDSNDGFDIYFSGGKCGLWNNGSSGSIISDVAIVADTRYSINAAVHSSGGSLSVNGESKTLSFSPATPSAANIVIFRHNHRYYFVGKIYDCELYDNDVLIRKFRPVRVGTDATSWEGAMMDVLTRRIYRNQGTGAFAYGNDLKYPIPAA